MNYEQVLKDVDYKDIPLVIQRWQWRLDKLNALNHPNWEKLVRLRAETTLRIFALKVSIEMMENEVKRRIANN